nr:monocarboxylate transporter 12-like [Leptinotarsa decemlineata]
MEPNASAPDGGWGWMVVIGAAMINMVNQAMFANFGLIYGETLKAMANGHATGITLVMAMSVVVTNTAGLVVGPLLKKISLRTLTFVAIACVGSGLIITSFATEIWHIVIGYSIFTGMGLGLLASGTFLIVNDYFTTKKSTAVGISMGGTAIGQMIMPTFIGMLLKKYGFSGTTFVLGFVSYSGIIGAIFFKPMFCCKKCAGTSPASENGNGMDNSWDSNEKPKNLQVQEEEVNLLKQKEEPQESTQGILKDEIENHYKQIAVEVSNSQLELNKGEEESLLKKIVKSLGLELLQDGYFVFILIGLGLIYVSTIAYNAFAPMFLQEEAKLSLMRTTSCMTAFSAADVLGRFTLPEISRRLHLTNKSTLILGCIFLSITRSSLVELEQFEYLCAVSFIVGYFRAIAVVNQNLVISEYISKDKLPSAVGLNMVMKALLTGTFGQSLGYLKDQFSYKFSIHVLDITVATVTVMWLMEAFIRRMRTSKKQDMPTNEIEKEII